MKRIVPLLLVLVSIILFLSFRLINTNKESNADNVIKPEITIVEEPEEIEPEIVVKEELLNILLIGVDGEGYDKDKRSDVMIIATLDVNAKALRLTSVARDTLAFLPESGTYEKMNHSYAKGGPKNTMAAINANLDLNIENYVVFDYNALIKAVDIVGGLPVNVTAQEVKDMNIHGDRISAGEQVFSGKDAITYMRIRKNSGGDGGRNQRQRDLIIHIMKEAKEMDKMQLLDFATSMLPSIKTSYNLFDVKELLDIYIKVRSGLVMEQYSYPFDYKGGKLSDKLWYMIPTNAKSNAIKFHEDVLIEDKYIPSGKLSIISTDIINKTGIDKEY